MPLNRVRSIGNQRSPSGPLWCILLISALLGGRGRRIIEFKASLVYSAQSRIPRATRRNPILEERKEGRKKEAKKEWLREIVGPLQCISEMWFQVWAKFHNLDDNVQVLMDVRDLYSLLHEKGTIFIFTHYNLKLHKDLWSTMAYIHEWYSHKTILPSDSVGILVCVSTHLQCPHKDKIT